MLVNIMEEIVADLLPSVLEAYDCCKCYKCQQDILAFSLNQLRPHYVVRTSGEVLTRFSLTREQEQADVITAIVKAVGIVSSNPRHDL